MTALVPVGRVCPSLVVV